MTVGMHRASPQREVGLDRRRSGGRPSTAPRLGLTAETACENSQMGKVRVAPHSELGCPAPQRLPVSAGLSTSSSPHVRHCHWMEDRWNHT